MIATLGVVAIVLQQIRTLPQIIRILRLRDATGVSALTWSLFLTSCITWFAYGIVAEDHVFVVNNVLNVIGAIAVLLAMARHGAASYRRPLVVSVLAVAIVLAILQVGGHIAFYAFAVGIGVVMFLPQAFKVFRSPSTGVSSLTWFLTALSSAAWLAYGSATWQPAILICHVVIFPCCVAILIRLRSTAAARRA